MIETKKFRKRPIVIEAFQFKAGMDADDLCQFITCDCDFSQGEGEEVFSMLIKTLEGDMEVNDGDWVIKGVMGEFYPCKPDIFAVSYEPV